jgi:hypothetical protein
MVRLGGEIGTHTRHKILWRGNGGGGAVNWISRVDLYNVSHIYMQNTHIIVMGIQRLGVYFTVPLVQ